MPKYYVIPLPITVPHEDLAEAIKKAIDLVESDKSHYFVVEVKKRVYTKTIKEVVIEEE